MQPIANTLAKILGRSPKENAAWAPSPVQVERLIARTRSLIAQKYQQDHRAEGMGPELLVAVCMALQDKGIDASVLACCDPRPDSTSEYALQVQGRLYNRNGETSVSAMERWTIGPEMDVKSIQADWLTGQENKHIHTTPSAFARAQATLAMNELTSEVEAGELQQATGNTEHKRRGPGGRL